MTPRKALAAPHALNAPHVCRRRLAQTLRRKSGRGFYTALAPGAAAGGDGGWGGGASDDDDFQDPLEDATTYYRGLQVGVRLMPRLPVMALMVRRRLLRSRQSAVSVASVAPRQPAAQMTGGSSSCSPLPLRAGGARAARCHARRCRACQPNVHVGRRRRRSQQRCRRWRSPARFQPGWAPHWSGHLHWQRQGGSRCRDNTCAGGPHHQL
jgi:hypothetical protein